MLPGKAIVLGVTGGIAAYKACEVVSRLKKLGASVRVVMTQSATKFVAPLTFQTLSGNPAYIDTFSQRHEMEHISLAKWADLFLIAPATANVIGKLTSGIADDLLTSVAMAMQVQTMLAPAMNTGMWKNPATRENVETLKRRGALFVGPEIGMLACGDEDIGRMSEPLEIVNAVLAHFERAEDMRGLSVVVTAGPTVEDIDPVRFISNRSSGKMGYAIAEAALKRGAEVTLITGPVAIKEPAGANVISVRSTMDLHRAVLALSETADVVIQAAAPADFAVAAPSDQKLKRTGEDLILTLTPNPDIAAALGAKKRAGQTLVAFAAETGAQIENARAKREKKRADLMVFNDVSAPGAGFDVDTNIVVLIDEGGEEALPQMPKVEVANRILDRILSLRK